MLDGHEISVVYFRAGYTPDDYPTNDEWEARGIEHFAVKCPHWISSGRTKRCNRCWPSLGKWSAF